MQNYIRSVKSCLWSWRTFHKLASDEKQLYLYMLTGPVTSDTSVYQLAADQTALDTGIGIERVEEIIRHFEELNLIVYDWEYEEVCVLDYFKYGSSPIGGLNYEMYCKDFEKINSDRLIGHVVESAKQADMSISFFAALQDIFPDISEDDYKIRKTEKTPEEIRDAAKRGRRKITEKRRMKTETEKNEAVETDSAEEYIELPF